MANAFSMMGDKLVNVLAQLGTGRDKASHSQLIFRPMTDLELSNAYRSAWLPKKIVNIPALDCVREWREWQAESDQISAISEVEKRLNLPEKLLKALKMARLYGKSYILIGTTDTDLSQELILDRMGADSLQYVTVLRKSELIASEREEDIGLPTYGQPKWYTIARDGVTRIHPSRLVILLGSEILDSDLEWEPGAGDSVLNTVMEAVMRAEGTDANVASLIFEAKIDIIGIPNLSKYISTSAGESALASRLTTVASMKGINGTLVKDSEETYDQKSANFATLPEIMQAFYGVVAGASDIPVTRLMGRSAAGMNATGEGDLTNYYDMIKSIQTLELTPAMFVLDEMIIRSALGSRPEEVFVEWAPLWQVSEKERAEIGKITVETGAALHTTGLVNPDVLAKSVTNALIEQGVFPGLEAAIDEFGIEPDEEDEAEAIAAAAALAEPVQGGQVEAPQANPPANAQDAAPRTLYARRDVQNADEIRRWAVSQGFSSTLKDLHVTIAYSKAAFDWMGIPEDHSGDQIRIPPGGVRLIEALGDEGDEDAAVALLFRSLLIEYRHREIIEAGGSHDFPDYQPHITISWKGAPADLSAIEPYQGEILLGPEVFEELDPEWTAEEK